MPVTALSVAAIRGGPRAFLGVERSITGRFWRDRLDEHMSARALSIVQRHGVPELLGRILAGRGVEVDATEAFLDPSLKRLMPDPNVVTDMAGAASRIVDAIERRERVAIFGDYDVDGATSAAVLTWFLRHAGIEPEVDELFVWSHLIALGRIPDEVTPRVGRGEFATITSSAPLDQLDAWPVQRERWLPALVQAVLERYRLESSGPGYYRYVPR